MSRSLIKKRTILFSVAITFTISIVVVFAFINPFTFQNKNGYCIKKIYYIKNHFRYASYIFTPCGKGPFPGIVFCHGNLPTGKDTALYMEMCKLLAKKGYAILSFDIKGFGESEKISKIRLPEDLNFVQDASWAVDYFSGLKILDNIPLTIIGHSSGGNIAMAAGSVDARVENIICISPGDFNPRKNPPGLKQHYRNRLAIGLEYSIPMDYYDTLVGPLTMLDYVSKLEDKNILFILAEHDHINQKRFSYNLLDEISKVKSKKLIEIKDAIHTIGARLVDGNKIEDISKISELVDQIDKWYIQIKSKEE